MEKQKDEETHKLISFGAFIILLLITFGPVASSSAGEIYYVSPTGSDGNSELIFKHITDADIVITTALVPGKKAPVLVTEEMVRNMRPGSVILDMAVEFGGNCEISEKGRTIKKYGVTLIGEPNLPSLVPTHSSEMYSKNLLALITYISKDGNVGIDLQNEIIKGSLIVYNGEVIHPRVKELIK